MAIGPGTRIGPYEVTDLLGEGGMGKVWRARHSSLKRDDALKVLPDDLAADPDRLARFQREAQLLASLNHPNIAHVYGLEQADGVQALVMELVDGETLADRLVRGPLAIEDALPIARQIADALETAHEQGIVHRDLKPANIKLRPDGTVKVLDFGLAKLASIDEPAPATDGRRRHLSNSPTITSPAMMTRVGVILGTAAYMSPEQARGRAVDKRADIWAFGCVLFEMITGRRVFDGDDVTETLAAVVKSEPPWSALPDSVPASIRRLIERCLRKDPARRLRDVADAKLDIDEALAEPHPAVSSTSEPHGTAINRRERWLWAAALGVVVVALAALIVAYQRVASLEPSEVRLQIVTPPGQIGDFAVSPDGRTVVFGASADGSLALWIRPLSATSAQRLAGTAGAEYPFWSPDSKAIGFFADQKLKRIEIASGTVQTLADAPAARGGSWGTDAIVFAPANISPLMRISARGGTPVEATRLAPEQASHRTPSFLPDGRRFLFFVSGPPSVQGVYLGSLDSTESRRLFEGDSAAVFNAPDVILFRREATLLAQRITPDTLEPVGDSFTVAESVGARTAIVGAIGASGSPAGVFAYRPATSAPRQFVWVDRNGTRVGTLGGPDDRISGIDASWRLSPDGRTLVATRGITNNGDLWLIDTTRGVPRPFISDAASDTYPTWSPDGRRLAFGSARLHGSVVHDLFEKSLDTPDNEMPLLESDENKTPTSWSADGRFIVYHVLSAKTGADIWVLPLNDRKPFAFVATLANEQAAAFSPDGRWLAYQSTETGRYEIYVQPFPGPARSTLVSAGGGTSPSWRGDGKEIFYRAPDNRVMAIPIETKSGTVEPGAPVELFTLRSSATFQVDRTGQRFLVNTLIDDGAVPPITVVLNWKAPVQ
jgi:eukaryotic-like serine/threonine-protein kinase